MAGTSPPIFRRKKSLSSRKSRATCRPRLQELHWRKRNRGLTRTTKSFRSEVYKVGTCTRSHYAIRRRSRALRSPCSCPRLAWTMVVNMRVLFPSHYHLVFCIYRLPLSFTPYVSLLRPQLLYFSYHYLDLDWSVLCYPVTVDRHSQCAFGAAALIPFC
jgi:hypothetical protein